METPEPIVWITAYDKLYLFKESQLLVDTIMHKVCTFDTPISYVTLEGLPEMEEKPGAWYFDIIYQCITCSAAFTGIFRCLPADVLRELMILIDHLGLQSLGLRIMQIVRTVPDPSCVYTYSKHGIYYTIQFNRDMTGRMFKFDGDTLTFGDFEYTTTLCDDKRLLDIYLANWNVDDTTFDTDEYSHFWTDTPTELRSNTSKDAFPISWAHTTPGYSKIK